MWIRVSNLELSENVWCDAIIEFRCVSRGYRGDFWDPGEGPEFEITDAYVDVAWSGHRDTSCPVDAWIEDWCKGRFEMLDWVGILDRRLDEVIDNLDIYDAQCDEFAGWGDY